MTNQIGIVFPGQGSQSVGMLADLALQYPVVRKTFDEASHVLQYDLWQLVQQGPSESLDQTEQTQPALLASGYAIWRILQSKYSVQVSLLAGHSLGEYTALVCAEAMRFQDAISLVAHRGKWMQEAVPYGHGAMAAILGLDEESVASICKKISFDKSSIVTPANINTAQQIVIAGVAEAVHAVIDAARMMGAKKTVLLPVSVPSHCLLMEPAAKKLSEMLTTISLQTPRIPVISNVDVKPYVDAAAIRDGLARQLFMPVRWVETMQAFIQFGITQVIECGPGQVLAGLGKRVEHLTFMTTFDRSHLEVLDGVLPSASSSDSGDFIC
ncbi:MAG: [acyl-carrier-protein] S-malonyltransferase [Gammaproteobacteria bacterium RIFCSPHIGHO2_12_FULL_42_10]|nr:MAG: [acyl-carrier-protein] S-malonyltransferase [Gammaproteobacteria bacterium RIFCSPHIGHO2_12_FULL_42_10]